MKMSNLLAILLIASIRLYRRIRPFRRSVCRFYPTCSTYAWQAIVVYGPWLGAWKALRRIARCHPFHPGGLDYV